MDIKIFSKYNYVIFSLSSPIQDISTKNNCQIGEEVRVILIWEYLKTPKSRLAKGILK